MKACILDFDVEIQEPLNNTKKLSSQRPIILSIVKISYTMISALSNLLIALKESQKMSCSFGESTFPCHPIVPPILFCILLKFPFLTQISKNLFRHKNQFLPVSISITAFRQGNQLMWNKHSSGETLKRKSLLLLLCLQVLLHIFHLLLQIRSQNLVLHSLAAQHTTVRPRDGSVLLRNSRLFSRSGGFDAVQLLLRHGTPGHSALLVSVQVHQLVSRSFHQSPFVGLSVVMVLTSITQSLDHFASLKSKLDL